MSHDAFIPDKESLLVNEDDALKIAMTILETICEHNHELGGCLKITLVVDPEKGRARLAIGSEDGIPKFGKVFECLVYKNGNYIKP